jgi:hypothetical protein
MPKRDETGPVGTGSNGRNRGNCTPHTPRNRDFHSENHGCCRRGRGLIQTKQDPADVKRALEEEKNTLESRLNEINKRMEEMNNS